MRKFDELEQVLERRDKLYTIEQILERRDFMYEFECLTTNDEVASNEQACSPFLGECYPIAEDCCGPDCDPN